MANFCDNTLFVSSSDEKNLQYISDYIGKNFMYADLYDSTEESLEMSFQSRWTFPKDVMNEMVENLPNKDDIFIRCMSIELENYYHELWIYKGDEWESI